MERELDQLEIAPLPDHRFDRQPRLMPAGLATSQPEPARGSLAKATKAWLAIRVLSSNAPNVLGTDRLVDTFDRICAGRLASV
jgi:hypothetical protein